MRFWRLYLAAWVRGWFYRPPTVAGMPEGYSGVWCGLYRWRDCLAMYRHGWEPWVFGRVPGCGITAGFRVAQTEEEKAFDRHMVESYKEMAERRDAMEAADYQ